MIDALDEEPEKELDHVAMVQRTARTILLNPQLYTAEEVQAATKALYPNTTSMRPPRAPPDNSPTPEQVLRYPIMYGPAKVAEAKATLEKENK